MLPDWVQTTRRAQLWSDHGGNSTDIVSVQAFQVLRVLGAEEGRLRVLDHATQALGWVDIRSVQPSDPPAHWLQNHRVTRGYENPSDYAPSGAAIAQFTYMRQVGEPIGDRIPVQVDPRTAKGPIVWVDAGASGPVGAPPRVVYTGSLPRAPRADNAMASRSAFLDAVGSAARASQASSGVPASVTVAQAILESDWGESSLARIANNYFGIKATGRIGSGGVVWMRTWEVIGGQDVFLQEPFRAYRSLADSVADHATLFTGLRLYSAAMKVVHDPLAFAEEIHTAGYSTDPSYVSKLARLMDQYDLGRLDRSDT
jgi:hypothetical protein